MSNLLNQDLIKYKLASDAMKSALWDMEVVGDHPVNADNKFTWSKEFRNMLGYTDENDFPNAMSSWSVLIHPDDKERVFDTFKTYLLSRESSAPCEVTYRLRVKNGNYRNFKTHGAIMRDSAGNPICMAGALTDITEDKQTHEQLETIWTRVESGIAIIDAETFEILVVNPAAVRMFGDDMGKMVGKSCHDVFCTAHKCPIVDLNQEVDRSERIFLNSNGEKISVIKSVTKIEYNGRPALLENFTDISHMKEAQEKQHQLEIAEQASQTKSAFLANMSHEIRTPMNAIIGMTELLLCSSNLTARDMDCLNDINVSAQSLLHIINDILDMSKIESGKMELNPIHYDFKAMINNEASMFTYVAKKKGIEFKLEKEDNIPKTLYGDDVRLRQVLTNICGNAVKFTDKGSVTLKISASEDTVTLIIKDTGMGIKKEDIPKLFQAFQQSKSEKNRYIAGTGLGLVISKSFIEMMGGCITLDSEYGEGTVFTITIPLVKGDPSKVKHRSEDHNQKICAPQAKILVTDDNEYNLKVAHGLLELYEIDADTAFSGKEAISLIKEKDYDIVFMDHMMPDMDGLETTEAIRAMGGKYSDLNIIALTANAIQGAQEMFLSNGFNGFLSKPIEMSNLTNILIEWLPAEKIIKKLKENNDNGQDNEYDDFFKTLDNIGEIDTEMGLRRFNGMKKMYHDSLKLFYDKLRYDSEKLNTFMNGQDYKNFSIAVHAIKSTLSGIGAAELSDAAFRLEMASKNKEIDYCVTHFPNFLDNLMFLDKRLSAVFPPAQTDAVKEKGDNARLMEHLPAVSEAIASYDNDAAVEVLNGLTAYDFGEENNTLLADLTAALKRYDFETAEVLLSEIK